ncbi:putative PHD finger and SET domain protein [Aspergillus novofumigatus IBT 16806]|uniref:Putative PHD finger and SET domain protein n=1 Tax=Aspergillus novofumigatus (strain IBT 16806) TaxID=1392255 RepID=A0A2I1CMT1_ASPN1|nr:putative PHD finger and SET domain protein [Aspergillus novofumigatus IBT 16806]PKX98926.1 putative PHD finger and SET domain protein [Aspergillus novofumigatus IBT 16806]
MTDTSPVAITHSTTEPYPVTVPLNSPALNGAVSDSAAPDEEEPYTIKCICAFEDDDGNTVFCEGCETWQHIECYYHGRHVPEVHNCVDCEPRYLDAKRATERQRRLREVGDSGDRKAKRAGAKGQKKRIKDHGDKVNGFHQRADSISRDQPPAKKAKATHRASGSISSVPGAAPFPPDARRRVATSMSPTKSLGPSIPLYSNEFLHLYDHDQDYAPMNSNLFVNLPLAADLASWVTEPTALARVSNGRSSRDIFTWSDTALDRSLWPSLSTETITDPSIDIEGQHPTWKVLRTRESVSKDHIVGEITGKIGLLRDYCLDPSNRWQELRHPEPFVFFHPQLPIYIDSRHEGSILRYVRRSCRPNVTIKTYITNEVEYHFCFVAKEDISADSEITAMWYLDPQLFESTHGLVKQEPSDSAQEVAAICISNVLANFGGCACEPSSNCLLASVDRRRHPKALESKQVNGKRKKAKTKSAASPPATNSRAGSETTKNMEDDDQPDSRSTSGSSRGQPRSRDLTPTLQHDGESELSAREKRKIAAAEKKFQQLEHDQQAHKKKKRNSGQATLVPQTQAGQSAHQAVSAQGHSRSSSSAQPSGSMPRKPSGIGASHGRSPLRRPHYVDSAIQTEPEADTSVLSAAPSLRRPSYVPLTQRLLKRCHADRVRLEGNSRRRPSPSPAALSPLSSSLHGGLYPNVTPLKTPLTEQEDVEMKDSDSPTVVSSGQSQAQEAETKASTPPSAPRALTKPPLPPPWPSTAAHNALLPGSKVNGHRTNLWVSLPPATHPAGPAAISPGSATGSTVSSPSTLDALAQPAAATPGSGVTAPSPVKKKLSLGDYLSRRGALTTPTSEKSQAQATAMLPPQKPVSDQSTATRDASAPVDTLHPEIKATGEAEATKRESPTSPDVTVNDAPSSAPTSHVRSFFF